MTTETAAQRVTRRHAAVTAALCGATLVVLGYASGWGLVVSSTAAATPPVAPPVTVTAVPTPITNTVVLPPRLIGVPVAAAPQDSPTYPMPTPTPTPTAPVPPGPTPTPAPPAGCTGLLGGLTNGLPLLGGVGALLDTTLGALPVVGPLVSPACPGSGSGPGSTSTPLSILGARR